MPSTRLSSKGQVIIPSAVRAAHQWLPGQDLEVIDTPEGVLLRGKRPFPPTELDAVAGMLNYQRPAKTLEEIEEAIARGVAEHYGQR